MGGPAPSAWPTPATLGGGAPPGAPPAGSAPGAATVSPGPSAPTLGGLDAAALRAGWDQVLAAVKSRKRTAHAQLADAQVASVTGRTLELAFQHAPILRQFQAGTGPEVLREALRESLGADLDLSFVLNERLSAHPTPVAQTAVAGSPVPYADFAPGDEVVPDDPDAPAPPAALRGEDAALQLVVDQLGGQVVSPAES